MGQMDSGLGPWHVLDWTSLNSGRASSNYDLHRGVFSQNRSKVTKNGLETYFILWHYKSEIEPDVEIEPR